MSSEQASAKRHKVEEKKELKMSSEQASAKRHTVEEKGEESETPWSKWPHELPQCKDAVELKDYFLLEDKTFHREMAMEIRKIGFDKCLSTLALKKDCKNAVLLPGGRSKDFALYCSDTEVCEFRQEAFFKYLFQINEPDCFGVLDLATSESLLFVPKQSYSSQRWNGELRPLSFYKERYGMDHAFYVQDLETVLESRGLKHLHLMKGQNTDSDSWFDNSTVLDLPFIKFSSKSANPQNYQDAKFSINEEGLFEILVEMRVIKTPKEQQFMKLATLISSQAHVYTMRHVKPGMTERQIEAMYKAWCAYFGGSRHLAYTCICGAANNGSVLHYGHAGRPNDCLLNDGDGLVLDMGAEYSGYATDITRSYPVNGKFTKDQAIVHNAVWAACVASFEMMKPGVAWSDVHVAAEKAILRHLLAAGIVKGGTIDEMMAVDMAAVFMPHGLGHLIGLNVHDVGGYTINDPPRSSKIGPCYLRTARVLKAGMAITVEPGVYFNEPTLKTALDNEDQLKYLDTEVLARFRGTGGCRIEDDLLITETGCENWTIVPSTVAEIEKVMLASKN